MHNWHPIGEERIRKEIWPVSHLKCAEGDIKAVAPLGSLIAIVSNTSDTHLPGGEDIKSVLKIYSGSCNLVTSVKWYVRVERILALQWTERLELAAVSANGSVRVYSAHGEHLRTFEIHLYGTSVSEDVDLQHIKLRCWGDGIIYLNVNSQLLYIQRGFDSTSHKPICLSEYASTITAIGIIPNKNWSDVVIIISTENGTSYVRMEHAMRCTNYDTLSLYLCKINPCSYTDVVSCPYYSLDGNYYVALGNRDNGVIASLSYCDTKFVVLWEINTGSYTHLCVLTKGILATVTTTRIKFILDAVHELSFNTRALCVSNEIGGGVRLFSTNSVEFYGVVSDESKYVLLTEKYHPASSLMRAFDLFKKGNPLSYESLYSIKDFIDDAYHVCVKAAQDEWDFNTCIHIIECGLFAKSLSSAFTRNRDSSNNLSVENEKKTGSNFSHKNEDHSGVSMDHFLVIAYLRIANAIKDEPSDIKTNAYQLLSLGIERMIVILTSLKCYLLAIRISKFLGINYNHVLLEWVHMRVKLGSHLTDSELYDIIIKRLENYAGMVLSFSDIAEVVSREGREALALSILDKEKSSINQFRVLCKWNQLSRAATVALDEGNPLLMNYVLLEANKHHNLSNVITLSKEYVLLRNLFIKQNLATGDRGQLQPFYEHTNDTFNAGLRATRHAISNFYNKSGDFDSDNTANSKDRINVHDYKEWLSYANGFFGLFTNKELDGQTPLEDSSFWYESINNQITLLNMQTEFESKNESLGNIVGVSLMETLFELYKVGLFKEAQLLTNTFKIPQNQIHCCKLVALYNSHNINELISMAQDKSLTSHFVLVKNSRPFTDLIIESLISLGASSFLDPVINNLKPQQQTYWINRINKRGKSDFKEDNINLLKSLGIKFWQ